MKTTIELPDKLLVKAKKAALERGITLKALLIEALEKTLGPQHTRVPELRTLVWPPAGKTVRRVSDDEILQMIRRERETNFRSTAQTLPSGAQRKSKSQK